MNYYDRFDIRKFPIRGNEIVGNSSPLLPTARSQNMGNIPPVLLKPSSDEQDYFFFGGHYIPMSRLNNNFFAMGVSRSGKTKLMKPAIARAIASIRSCYNHKVIVFDTKGDMYPFISKIANDYGIPFFSLILVM